MKCSNKILFEWKFFCSSKSKRNLLVEGFDGVTRNRKFLHSGLFDSKQTLIKRWNYKRLTWNLKASNSRSHFFVPWEDIFAIKMNFWCLSRFLKSMDGLSYQISCHDGVSLKSNYLSTKLQGIQVHYLGCLVSHNGFRIVALS